MLANRARLEKMAEAAAILAFERLGDSPPGIMGEILAGNPDRFPDRESVAAAFTEYMTAREPDEPGRKLMCLYCGSIVVVLMSEPEGCPRCGRQLATDLGVTVGIELSEHEYRVLTAYAENWARSYGGDPVQYMATILGRLTAQGAPDTMTPETREILVQRAAIP